MLYILIGPDDYSLTQSLNKIKQETGDPASLAISTTTLDGRQVTFDELKTVCETAPFLSGKRLVIIEGLLRRFEPSSRPRRQPRTRQANEQSDKHKPFATCLSNIPESTVVVMVDDEIKGSNPLFKELAGKATVKSFPLLKEAQVREWVQRLVAVEGASISTAAVASLVRLVGSNLWTLSSEIEKLVLFAESRRIEESDVRLTVGYAQQTSVFNMIDAIVDSKAELAEQALQQLLQSGTAPAYLLTMLARQVQLIVRAKELKTSKTTNSEIQAKLGLNSEYVLRKTLEQAGRYSLPRLKEVYHHLLNADLSIKTGKYDAELSLTILVAELCQQSKLRLTPTRS